MDQCWNWAQRPYPLCVAAIMLARLEMDGFNDMIKPQARPILISIRQPANPQVLPHSGAAATEPGDANFGRGAPVPVMAAAVAGTRCGGGFRHSSGGGTGYGLDHGAHGRA